MAVRRKGLARAVGRASFFTACLALASEQGAARSLAQDATDARGAPTAPAPAPWGAASASEPPPTPAAAPEATRQAPQSVLDELPAWLADVPPPPGVAHAAPAPTAASEASASPWQVPATATARSPRQAPAEWARPAAGRAQRSDRVWRTERARGPADHGGGRVGGELLGALGGLAVSSLVGIGITVALLGDGDYGGALAGVLLGTSAFVFGVPLGVYLAGNAGGGDGSYWSTFGAHLAGTLLGGLVLGAAIGSESGTAIAFGVIGFFTLEIGGAILGYEGSTSPSPARGVARSRPRFAPTLAASHRGATLGLAGAF